jgi:DNA-binding response OmpR family regulator
MLAERPVLIVDGDADLRAILVEQLAVDREFAVTQAGTLREAEGCLAAQNARFDAVILDECLPDGDGWALRARLREAGRKGPIIMLTGAAELNGAGEAEGLRDGGGDTLAKPFRLVELLTRLRTLLRGFDNSADGPTHIGKFILHPAAKCLVDTASDRRIRLTEKEVAILKFLHAAGGRAVTRQVLLNEVWGYNAAVTTHTLETHIYRLRRKIEPDAAHARLLLTEGGGYRLDLAGAL